jgi:hypothetical protein
VSSIRRDHTLRPTGTDIAVSFRAAALRTSGACRRRSERLPLEEALTIVEQDVEAPVVEIRTEAGGVGRDEDAGQRPQRVIGGQRLLLEDVEPGPGDLARPQRGDEIVEARGHAAPDIDEERPWASCAESARGS